MLAEKHLSLICRAPLVLGETGVPYDWEYSDHAGKS